MFDEIVAEDMVRFLPHFVLIRSFVVYVIQSILVESFFVYATESFSCI